MFSLKLFSDYSKIGLPDSRHIFADIVVKEHPGVFQSDARIILQLTEDYILYYKKIPKNFEGKNMLYNKLIYKLLKLKLIFN